MEAVLRSSGLDVCALRPGAIYGPGLVPGGRQPNREWSLFEHVHRGEHQLKLPERGNQLFHPVAVGRVGRAVARAVELAQAGFWPCNVVDPSYSTYAGRAAQIGELLGWRWDPVPVGFEETDHPRQAAHPIIASDLRLREALGVHEP